MQIERGLAVSPGVVVAAAYCIDDIFVGPQAKLADEVEAAAELRRFEEACDLTARDLQSLRAKVAQQVGESEAEIFAAHELILRDPAFKTKVRTAIGERHLTAPAALLEVLDEYSLLFTRTEDPYLRERLVDLQDVIQRLSGHLSPALQPQSHALPDDVIVVAREIMPSQVITLGDREVAGIVTEKGGPTSHAAIIARSRGIPAVTGVTGICSLVRNGDLLIVDGREGSVMLTSDAETQSAYRKLQREFVDLKDRLAANREQPALSADGEPVELLANINNLADAKAAAAMGATGIGLYRTEFFFLTHESVPDEDEQLEVYRQIIASSPGNKVTLRTLDLGGDKSTPYLGSYREANPFMGWRSLRMSFERPEFFLTQLRAALRASVCPTHGPQPLRLLFPMITTLEEVRKVRSLVRKARRQLEKRGEPAGEVPMGLMIEVPAAAVSIRSLVREVDFVSIGSNDLIQYLMAADRDNPKVAHLCQPLSPPVLHVLRRVIRACRAAEKPVTLCGEMAALPRAVVLLYAMGLRSLSMSPSFIPTIKDLISRLTAEQTQQILQRALRLKTHRQIAHFMTEQLDQICPDLKVLEPQS